MQRMTEEDTTEIRRRIHSRLVQRGYMSEQSEKDGKLKGVNLDEDDDDTPQSPYNLHTLFWILASIAVLYYTDFAVVIVYHNAIDRMWLNVGVFMIGVNVFIGLYFIVVCAWILKDDNWESHWPSAVPVATASFIVGAICCTVALWPVWSYYTPLILFTLFMGFIVTISLLPNF